MDAVRRWIDQEHVDWLDSDGRPLGEVGSRHYDATGEAPCWYPGSRNGLPMNVGALEQYARWRDRCLATVANAAGQAPTVGRLFLATTRILASPLALGAATPPLAALYKTTLGYHQVIVSRMLAADLAASPAGALGDGTAMLADLERDGWLVGRRQACAGAPGDIARTWDVLTGRARPPDAAPIPLASPDAGAWAASITGLAIALLLATQARRPDASTPPPRDAPLGLRLWHRPMASWMAIVVLHQELAVEHAARLFETTPATVARFIAGAREAGGHPELETLFWTCAQEVRAW